MDFKKYETKTYFGVLGFIFASVLAIPIAAMSDIKFIFNAPQIIFGLIFLGLGLVIGYKLGEK